MFAHAAQVFSGRPSQKRTSRRASHLRNISISSANSSASSTTSGASSASSIPASSTSSTFSSSSPTTIRHGPFSSSPTSSKPRDSFLEFDPLSQHPTFWPPPPPLSERPLLDQSAVSASRRPSAATIHFGQSAAPTPRRPSAATVHFDYVAAPAQRRPSAVTIVSTPESESEPTPVPVPAPAPTLETPTPMASHVEWRADLDNMFAGNVPQFPHDVSPRHTIHTSTPVTNAASTSAQDYFVLKIPARPELKSHWSASTIDSSSSDDDYDEDENEEEYDGGALMDLYYEEDMDPTPGLTPSQTPTPPATAILSSSTATCSDDASVEPTPQLEKATTMTIRNFSYKRCTFAAPASASTFPISSSSSSSRRPQMKTMDSIENWIKRGGWKRRGIVFQQGEGGPMINAGGNAD